MNGFNFTVREKHPMCVPIQEQGRSGYESTQSKGFSLLVIPSMGSELNLFQYLSSVELDAISIDCGTSVNLSPFRMIRILIRFPQFMLIWIDSSSFDDFNRFRFIRWFKSMSVHSKIWIDFYGGSWFESISVASTIWIDFRGVSWFKLI